MSGAERTQTWLLFACISLHLCFDGAAYRVHRNRHSDRFMGACVSAWYCISNNLDEDGRLIIKIRKRRIVLLFGLQIKMFSVVDFPDEESCEVIPTFWLTDGNHKTFYPQYKGTRFWKAVTTFETPKSCWKTHSCRVLYQTDLLTKAKSKKDGYQYLDTDEIQTGTEVIENKINKRKRFPNQRYASKSASEISSDEASLSSENDDKIEIEILFQRTSFNVEKKANLYLNQNLLNYRLVMIISKISIKK
ncbi:uncharacterized protein [Polyergus mexicanus]|uniref:uncharacterized protein isoform X1 n=1 Tax=Polyergus mexicanus TaxID=615972 RepID=UPI0038B5938D